MTNMYADQPKPSASLRIAAIAGTATLAYFLGKMAQKHGGVVPALKELGPAARKLGETGSVIFGKFRRAANDDKRLSGDLTATGT